MGDSAAPFVQAGLSLCSTPPPVPLEAWWDATSEILQVVFDRGLQTATLAASNWTMALDGDLYYAITAAAAAESVYCQMQTPGGLGGPDGVDYLASPPDVISALGTPAAAFSGFPITPV